MNGPCKFSLVASLLLLQSLCLTPRPTLVMSIHFCGGSTSSTFHILVHYHLRLRKICSTTVFYKYYTVRVRRDVTTLLSIILITLSAAQCRARRATGARIRQENCYINRGSGKEPYYAHCPTSMPSRRPFECQRAQVGYLSLPAALSGSYIESDAIY